MYSNNSPSFRKDLWNFCFVFLSGSKRWLLSLRSLFDGACPPTPRRGSGPDHSRMGSNLSTRLGLSVLYFVILCDPSWFFGHTPRQTHPRTQPVVGVISDHREGQGQRSFFLAAGTIIMAASLALLPAAGAVCRHLAGSR